MLQRLKRVGVEILVAGGQVALLGYLVGNEVWIRVRQRALGLWSTVRARFRRPPSNPDAP